MGSEAHVSQEVIQVVNPTGARESKAGRLAPRKFDSLRRKRIGLLDNNKPNADEFLAEVGAILQQRYEDIELVARRKTARTAADCLKELAERCDVVINAFAD